MKKLLSTIFLGLLVLITHNAFALNGTIKGEITDEDQFSLAGANVFIRALNIGTASDYNGVFTILNVPVGTYDLEVSYIGYESKTISVTVEKDKVVEADVTLKAGVLTGAEVYVLGERLKGQAKALNQQKNNVSISNIVAADQIGRFPDANIGDAVKRIPAIHVNYDQGEARFVNIRGTEPRLNAVMINGERIPSAEAEIRAAQVDLVPSEMIQSIEVTKALTADMDGDAIGGAINLITRQAPHDLRMSATLGSGYNFLSEEPQYLGSMVLAKRFLNDKLGVVLSGSYHDHNLGSHNTEGEWEEPNLAGEWEVRKYEIRRLRQSVSLNLDYEINPAHKLFFNSIYNHRNDWENRFAMTYKDLDDMENGIVEEAEIEKELKGGSNNDRVDNARLEDQRISTLGLNGDHIFGNRLKVKWGTTWAKAFEDRPDERYIVWVAEGVRVRPDYSDQENPYFNFVDPGQVTADKFELDEITEEYQNTEQINITAKVDFEIPLKTEGQNKNSIKFGAKYKSKDKDRNNNFFEYKPLNDRYENMSLAQIKDYTVDDFLAGDYKSGIFSTAEFLGSLDLNNPSLFEKEDVPDEYAGDNYEITEKVTAGYLMFSQELGDKIGLNLGLRVENTSVDYDANQYSEVIVDGGEERENVVTPVSGSKDYTNLLPSVHVKYLYDSNTIFRFAWTNTIARPNFYDNVPFRTLTDYDDDEDFYEELVVGNPDLEPTTSMNFDLMAEKYFETVGIVSAGVFYKDIKDFIYVEKIEDFQDAATGKLVEEYFKPQNGAKAKLFGFEFAFQRQLNFLPGLLSNFGIYTNYTYTYSEADNPQLKEDFDLDDTIELPGTAPHSLNTALSYQTPKMEGSLSFNYTSSYIDPDDLDLTPGLERYYDKVTYLDFSGSYKITPQLRFFVEANNLLNQPLRYYAGDSDRTYQAEYYNRRFSAGLKFDL